jgi:histidyl-tRNA synthetase
MAEISAPKGVRDILPVESWKWSHVFRIIQETARHFGYSEVHLPIFEHTELFSRGIGDTTDVVEKEMYTFLDKGERSMTLRPEATASMVRSYLEHHMSTLPQPVKMWCAGPMFRFERPQKGRYRQFWQVDFESIGAASPYADIEVVALSLEIFRRLGLRQLEVVINSVGCPECRPEYRRRLTEFFSSRKEHLCETCGNRLERNPLRILDCKRESCRNATEDAPDIYDSLCAECREHFDMVKAGLDAVGASYRLDKRLVRGLDYYTKTAYEILSGALGSQNAVCGGGRYDNLAEAIGGPHVPGVGFAAGVDRILMVMEQQECSFGPEPSLEVFAIALDNTMRRDVLRLVDLLRRNGIVAEMDFCDRSMKAQMKAASSRGARFACILGENERNRQTVMLKDLSTAEQREVPVSSIVLELNNKLTSTRKG